VLYHFSNLTKKSNLIGRLQCDLSQFFFDNLVVAYFLGHLVCKRTLIKLILHESNVLQTWVVI